MDYDHKDITPLSSFMKGVLYWKEGRDSFVPFIIEMS